MAKNLATGTKWVPGVVKNLVGKTMVAVELDDGRIWRHHIDHIIQSHTMTEDTETDSEFDFNPLTMPSIGTDDEQCNNDQLDNTREEMQDRNIQVKIMMKIMVKIVIKIMVKIMTKIMCKKMLQHQSSGRLGMS